MPRYGVPVTVDASILVFVDAENEEEAKEKAMDVAIPPSICHQCAREVEIGDPTEAYDPFEVDPSTKLTEDE